MKANPVGWFEIYVQDMPRAKTFYETVFQVELQPLEASVKGMEMLTFPMEENLYGAPGALARMNGVPSGGNSVLVYFSCADCAVEAGRVAAAGGEVEVHKMPIGEHGFIAIVQDTEGNMIGLHSLQ